MRPNPPRRAGLHRLALACLVRLALLSALLVAAGCQWLPATADEVPDGPPPARSVAAHPDSLLARLTPRALDDAFDGARLTGRFADGDGPAQPMADPARSPLPLVLPDAPPFAEPRTRDQYDRRRVPTTWPRAAAAEAVYQPEGRVAQAVRRAVVVVDTTTGRVLAAEVWRASRSLLYDETTHVQAWRSPATGRAARVRVDVATDTPGAPPRRYVRTWSRRP